MQPGSCPLGEAIRRARVAKGMSLRALAERIGVSAPFLSDLEHGRRNTTELPRIAQVLDVPLEELRRLEARVEKELKEWLEANPGILALLRDTRRRCRCGRCLVLRGGCIRDERAQRKAPKTRRGK